jgi:DNA ligase-1
MGGYTTKYKRLTACNTLVKPYITGMEFALLRDWSGQDISGWIVSEKLDGWRCGWDGADFITRQGEVLDAPDWFRAGMPAFALDGELFAGRGNFNRIQSMMRDGWHGLTFEVFDCPDSQMPFHARARIISSMPLPSHCNAVTHRLCVNAGDMMGFGVKVCTEGGEGAVVRRADSQWKAGRSGDVLRYVPQSPRINRIR